MAFGLFSSNRKLIGQDSSLNDSSIFSFFKGHNKLEITQLNKQDYFNYGGSAPSAKLQKSLPRGRVQSQFASTLSQRHNWESQAQPRSTGGKPRTLRPLPTSPTSDPAFSSDPRSHPDYTSDNIQVMSSLGPSSNSRLRTSSAHPQSTFASPAALDDLEEFSILRAPIAPIPSPEEADELYNEFAPQFPSSLVLSSLGSNALHKPDINYLPSQSTVPSSTSVSMPPRTKSGKARRKPPPLHDLESTTESPAAQDDNFRQYPRVVRNITAPELHRTLEHPAPLTRHNTAPAPTSKPAAPRADGLVAPQLASRRTNRSRRLLGGDLDSIDELDETDPMGLSWRHDSRYPAVALLKKSVSNNHYQNTSLSNLPQVGSSQTSALHLSEAQLIAQRAKDPRSSGTKGFSINLKPGQILTRIPGHEPPQPILNGSDYVRPRSISSPQTPTQSFQLNNYSPPQAHEQRKHVSDMTLSQSKPQDPNTSSISFAPHIHSTPFVSSSLQVQIPFPFHSDKSQSQTPTIAPLTQVFQKPNPSQGNISTATNSNPYSEHSYINRSQAVSTASSTTRSHPNLADTSMRRRALPTPPAPKPPAFVSAAAATGGSPMTETPVTSFKTTIDPSNALGIETPRVLSPASDPVPTPQNGTANVQSSSEVGRKANDQRRHSPKVTSVNPNPSMPTSQFNPAQAPPLRQRHSSLDSAQHQGRKRIGAFQSAFAQARDRALASFQGPVPLPSRKGTPVTTKQLVEQAQQKQTVLLLSSNPQSEQREPQGPPERHQQSRALLTSGEQQYAITQQGKRSSPEGRQAVEAPKIDSTNRQALPTPLPGPPRDEIRTEQRHSSRPAGRHGRKPSDQSQNLVLFATQETKDERPSAPAPVPAQRDLQVVKHPDPRHCQASDQSQNSISFTSHDVTDERRVLERKNPRAQSVVTLGYPEGQAHPQHQRQYSGDRSRPPPLQVEGRMRQSPPVEDRPRQSPPLTSERRSSPPQNGDRGLQASGAENPRQRRQSQQPEKRHTQQGGPLYSVQYGDHDHSHKQDLRELRTPGYNPVRPPPQSHVPTVYRDVSAWTTDYERPRAPLIVINRTESDDVSLLSSRMQPSSADAKFSGSQPRSPFSLQTQAQPQHTASPLSTYYSVKSSKLDTPPKSIHDRTYSHQQPSPSIHQESQDREAKEAKTQKQQTLQVPQRSFSVSIGNGYTSEPGESRSAGRTRPQDYSYSSAPDGYISEPNALPSRASSHRDMRSVMAGSVRSTSVSYTNSQTSGARGAYPPPSHIPKTLVMPTPLQQNKSDPRQSIHSQRPLPNTALAGRFQPTHHSPHQPPAASYQTRKTFYPPTPVSNINNTRSLPLKENFVIDSDRTRLSKKRTNQTPPSRVPQASVTVAVSTYSSNLSKPGMGLTFQAREVKTIEKPGKPPRRVLTKRT